MIEKVTLHVFSDGCGLVDLGSKARPQDIEWFREHWKKSVVELPKETLFFAGVEVIVVNHPSPLKRVELRDDGEHGLPI